MFSVSTILYTSIAIVVLFVIIQIIISKKDTREPIVQTPDPASPQTFKQDVNEPTSFSPEWYSSSTNTTTPLQTSRYVEEDEEWEDESILHSPPQKKSTYRKLFKSNPPTNAQGQFDSSLGISTFIDI